MNDIHLENQKNNCISILRPVVNEAMANVEIALTGEIKTRFIECLDTIHADINSIIECLEEADNIITLTKEGTHE